MIDDSILIYLVFQLILVIINVIGYTRIPVLMLFGIIGTLMITIPTIEGFGDYSMFAGFLIMINVCLPVIGLTRTVKGD